MRADFGITYDADALKLIDDLADWGITAARRGHHPLRQPVRRQGLQEQAGAPRRPRSTPTASPRATRPRSTPSSATRATAPTSTSRPPSPSWWSPAPAPAAASWPPASPSSTTTTGAASRSGYAKFETFPIWNLPLKHPVNIAYEAATADLKDINLIDPFHLEAYDVKAVNYNRDVEAFPLVRRILEKITENPLVYHSPTDMGVNRAGFGIRRRRASCARPPPRRSSAATSATSANTPWAWWTRTRWSACACSWRTWA